MGTRRTPPAVRTPGRHRGRTHTAAALAVAVDSAAPALRATATVGAAAGAAATVGVLAGATAAAAAVPIATATDFARLRMCESSGNYAVNTGNGYYGAYQFDLRTWWGLGYTGLPSNNPPAVQDQAARRLEAARGWEPWPACSAHLRLGLGEPLGIVLVPAAASVATEVDPAPVRVAAHRPRQHRTGHPLTPGAARPAHHHPAGPVRLPARAGRTATPTTPDGDDALRAPAGATATRPQHPAAAPGTAPRRPAGPRTPGGSAARSSGPALAGAPRVGAPRFGGQDLSTALAGQRRADVLLWQSRMARRGWRISIDGYFGPQSAAVAAAFAAEKGVAAPAGTVTAAVWQAAWLLPVT